MTQGEFFLHVFCCFPYFESQGTEEIQNILTVADPNRTSLTVIIYECQDECSCAGSAIFANVWKMVWKMPKICHIFHLRINCFNFCVSRFTRSHVADPFFPSAATCHDRRQTTREVRPSTIELEWQSSRQVNVGIPILLISLQKFTFNQMFLGDSGNQKMQKCKGGHKQTNQLQVASKKVEQLNLPRFNLALDLCRLRLEEGALPKDFF